MRGYINLTRAASIDGADHPAGTLVEVSVEDAQQLFEDSKAVPCNRPGERSLHGAMTTCEIKVTTK
ncbi:hypothetical protein MASR1M60_30630 [Rhodocyclaceae bacterium]